MWDDTLGGFVYQCDSASLSKAAEEQGGIDTSLDANFVYFKINYDNSPLSKYT